MNKKGKNNLQCLLGCIRPRHPHGGVAGVMEAVVHIAAEHGLFSYIRLVAPSKNMFAWTHVGSSPNSVSVGSASNTRLAMYANKSHASCRRTICIYSLLCATAAITA